MQVETVKSAAHKFKYRFNFHRKWLRRKHRNDNILFSGFGEVALNIESIVVDNVLFSSPSTIDTYTSGLWAVHGTDG